jgi:hypothetical protein
VFIVDFVLSSKRFYTIYIYIFINIIVFELKQLTNNKIYIFTKIVARIVFSIFYNIIKQVLDSSAINKENWNKKSNAFIYNINNNIIKWIWNFKSMKQKIKMLDTTMLQKYIRITCF